MSETFSSKCQAASKPSRFHRFLGSAEAIKQQSVNWDDYNTLVQIGGHDFNFLQSGFTLQQRLINSIQQRRTRKIGVIISPPTPSDS